MATNANVILKALLDGVVTELMVKTSGGQVWLDETTTVSAKIAELVAAVNERAKTTDMETAIETEIDALRQELLGDTPVEAYNTFTELAQYIETHQEAADALTAAIGDKADKSVVEAMQATIEALGTLANKDKVAEEDLDDALKAKVNAAAEGNHSHANKAVLDGITAEKVTAWDGAATDSHTHENAEVLDGVTAEKVTAWDGAATDSHTHENAEVLDGVTAEKVAAWDGAVTDSHTHENAAVLEGITAEKVAGWDGITGVRIGSSEPVDLKAGELFIQLA